MRQPLPLRAYTQPMILGQVNALIINQRIPQFYFRLFVLNIHFIGDIGIGWTGARWTTFINITYANYALYHASALSGVADYIR